MKIYVLHTNLLHLGSQKAIYLKGRDFCGNIFLPYSRKMSSHHLCLLLKCLLSNLLTNKWLINVLGFSILIFRSEYYKTSLLYGDKMLLMSHDLFSQLNKYITFLRPLIVPDPDCSYVFTSSRYNPKEPRMTHSLVSGSLTATVKAANILAEKT